MIKQTYGGSKWAFPGGGIHKGETLEEAVIREVREEVGLELENVKKMGEFFTTIEFKRDTIYCFSAEAKDSNLRIDRKEVKKAEWFNISDLPELSIISKQVINFYK